MKRIIIISCCVFCFGCERDYAHRGNYITEDDASSVVVGKSSKKDVQKHFGSAFLITKDNTWIYMGRRESRVPFKHPVVENSFGYIVSFDNKDIVKSVRKINASIVKMELDKENTRVNSKSEWK